MKPKTVADLIRHHNQQADLYLSWAAIAEADEEDEKAAAHLELHKLHKDWAEELGKFGTAIVDNLDALMKPLFRGRPMITSQPLNPSAARHA